MNYNLTINEETKPLELESRDEAGLTVSIAGNDYHVDYVLVSDHQIHLTVNGRAVNAFVTETAGGKSIHINGIDYQVQDADLLAARPKKKGGISRLPTEITPQTPSVVVSVLVKEGEQVEKGQGVIVLSAMKMETTLNAPFKGNVKAVNASEGDKVSPGDILVDIDQTSDAETETDAEG